MSSETDRPRLTEELLRETKDDLMSRTTGQQRAFGQTPDVAAAEAFIAPILRKVEIDHERNSARPSRAQNPTAKNEAIGTVTFKSNGDVTTDVPSYIRTPCKPSLTHQAIRARFRFLYDLPEWRERVNRVLMAEMPPLWKEAQYRLILSDSIRAFGKLVSKREPQVFVHGK